MALNKKPMTVVSIGLKSLPSLFLIIQAWIMLLATSVPGTERTLLTELKLRCERKAAVRSSNNYMTNIEVS